MQRKKKSILRKAINKIDLLEDKVEQSIKDFIIISTRKAKNNTLNKIKSAKNHFFEQIKNNNPKNIFFSYDNFPNKKRTYNHQNNKSRNDEYFRTIEKNLSKSQSPELLIKVMYKNKKEIKSISQEAGNELAKIIGSDEWHAFNYVPYIAVKCDIKEIGKLESLINSKNFKKLSKKLSNMGRYFIISNAERTSPIALPEKEWNYKPAVNKQSIWNLENIDAYEAQNITQGEGALVAIIDTGIDYNHEQLANNFNNKKGKNIITDNNDPYDDNGHGTHVAGIVAGNNIGVAPYTTLLAVKVLNSQGSGWNSDVVKGIEYAIDNKVDVINMSLGSPSFSKLLDEACEAAYNKGIIVSAAAGNDSYGYNYPACCYGVVSVAAVDKNNKHANFSNINDMLDISAPGVNIYSSVPGNGYAVYSGTSMASPHIAGTAALARSLACLSPEEFYWLLGETAKEIGIGEPKQKEKYGFGLVNANSIVEQNTLYNRIKTKLLDMV